MNRGLSGSKIAAILKMGRKRVATIISHLIETKKKGKQRVSQLKAYHAVISDLFMRGHTVAYIKSKLPVKCKKINRSTLWRYIQQHCKSSSATPLDRKAGEVAYVSVVRLKDAKDIYLFSLLLGRSRYGYFCVFKFDHVKSFLKCHARGFRYFAGVPRCIVLCEISGLDLSDSEKSYYRAFLFHYGTIGGTPQMHSPDANQCSDQVGIIKEQISCYFFHDNFKKIARRIRYTYMPAYNASRHPETGRSISQEFKQNEADLLLQLPRKSFRLYSNNAKRNQKNIKPIICSTKKCKHGSKNSSKKNYQKPT